MRALKQRLAIHRRQRAFEQWETLVARLASGVHIDAKELENWEQHRTPADDQVQRFSVPAASAGLPESTLFARISSPRIWLRDWLTAPSKKELEQQAARRTARRQRISARLAEREAQGLVSRW